jgi:hypothetical protein
VGEEGFVVECEFKVIVLHDKGGFFRLRQSDVGEKSTITLNWGSKVEYDPYIY